MSGEVYTITLPKVLFLALLTSHHFKKKHYYNTNDMVESANQLAKELVRLRSDKKDYKFLDDTNFGGLRGNFSTLVTFRGLVRKGSRITPYYGLGKDDRLLNAVARGEIVLDKATLSAHTKNVALRNLLKAEARMFTIREEQAHIKAFLRANPDVKLSRDNINFPKEAVVKSEDDSYFLRALINNYVDTRRTIVEYHLINYWQGKKFTKKNTHLLLVVPSSEHSWDEIYAVSSEELYEHKPLFLRIDTDAGKCYDRQGNVYQLVSLDEALTSFSKEDANINSRLHYNWDKLKQSFCEEEAPEGVVNDDEFSVFLKEFLQWNKEFSIEGKDVVDMQVSGSGGADVRLRYSGGTTQKLELEHRWANYFAHSHHLNPAFAGCWLYAAEAWDPDLIIRLFGKLKVAHGTRVPDIFLCTADGKRKAFRANWSDETFEEIPVS